MICTMIMKYVQSVYFKTLSNTIFAPPPPTRSTKQLLIVKNIYIFSCVKCRSFDRIYSDVEGGIKIVSKTLELCTLNSLISDHKFNLDLVWNFGFGSPKRLLHWIWFMLSHRYLHKYITCGSFKYESWEELLVVNWFMCWPWQLTNHMEGIKGK